MKCRKARFGMPAMFFISFDLLAAADILEEVKISRPMPNHRRHTSASQSEARQHDKYTDFTSV
jgi:hypothetical protein